MWNLFHSYSYKQAWFPGTYRRAVAVGADLSRVGRGKVAAVSVEAIQHCLWIPISITLALLISASGNYFFSGLVQGLAESVSSASRAGERDKALSSLNQYHAQARILARQGEHSKAVYMYLKAIQNSSADGAGKAELLNDLGVTLIASGQYSQARHYLEQAVRLEPNHLAAANNLAVLRSLGTGRSDRLTREPSDQHRYSAKLADRIDNRSNASTREPVKSIWQ